MKNNNRFIDFIPLIITYIVVKVMHKLVGFNYDPFREGILNVKFLIDIMSWIIVYAVIYILMKKLLPQKNV